MTIHIQTVPARTLTPKQLAEWSAIATQNSRFDNPFFRPEFTKLVAAIREDIEVIFLKRKTKIVGLLPYYRCNGNIALPVADTLTDLQGVIVRDDVEWTPQRLLKGSHLTTLRFDRVPESQTEFSQAAWMTIPTRSINLHAANEPSPNLQSLWCEMEQEAGGIRLETHHFNSATYETLLQWKLEEYSPTQGQSILETRWARELLQRVAQFESPRFSGRLSVLSLSGHPVSIQLAMVANGVWHVWLSASDPNLSSFSVAALHIWRLITALKGLGFHRMDLGRDASTELDAFVTDSPTLVAGTVDLRPVAGRINKHLSRAKGFLATSGERIKS